MLKKCIDWVAPITCIICSLPSIETICRECLQELPWLVRGCKICANEYSSDTTSMYCGECLIDPPPFDCNVTLFRYHFPLPSLITKLKFSKRLHYAKTLGTILATQLKIRYETTHDELPQCIIPVPLHRRRLIARGYNQALEIAQPIKRQLGIAIDYRCVERIRITSAQTLIPATERLNNVKGAFKATTNIPYQHVSLVDDVATTYSTLSELAKELRAKGVKRIDVWCIARA